jgi:oxygen-independent coproporphyrinogen-3 oxidase
MAGCYIHIPFCAKKCTYCDFYFSTTYHSYRSRLLEALAREISLRAENWTFGALETLYFGGGTPSLLTGKEVSELIAWVVEKIGLNTDAEITLECNPDDCTLENLHAWKQAGVSRLSIGIQSFQSEQLDWMNRTHTANEGLEAVKRAKEVGFDALTVDLMYGLPNLSLVDWEHQLDAVLALEVDHISAYCLTVEEKTALATFVKQGKLFPATADQQSDQFELLVTHLAAKGYEQYEISNFAKNNCYSKHNSAYWKGKPYLGIGPSAHGFDGVYRSWNVSNNQQYIKEIEHNQLPETREKLTIFDRFNEAILIGLRTKWGVSLVDLEPSLMDNVSWKKIVNNYVQSQDMIQTETHLILTPKGRLIADAIAADLFCLEK